MEHRFGQRQPVHLGIQLYLENLPTLVALTRNVSRNGLNLALTHPTLARNCMLKVALTDGRDAGIWQTWALVVHSSEKAGTGLVLEEGLPEEIYNAHQAAPPHRDANLAES